jgi:hypothetical protein
MPQRRAYVSNAERQKAYRERLKCSQNSDQQQKPETRILRPLSRPKRLTALLKEAEDLLSGYTDWLKALPESLQEGGTAERLQETIDSLEQVVELLSDIEAPRGFGRD